MSAKKLPIALFRLGRLVATPNALEKLKQPDILVALQRHQAGDWGDVDEHDRQANDRALTEGTRVFSVYHSTRKVKFWIITEADRIGHHGLDARRLLILHPLPSSGEVFLPSSTERKLALHRSVRKPGHPRRLCHSLAFHSERER